MRNTSSKAFKPGEKGPTSSQYEIRGPRGGEAGGKERTITRGEPLPPTPEPGQKYVFRDQTKTKRLMPFDLRNELIATLLCAGYAPMCTSTAARSTGRTPRISSAKRAAACSLSLIELPSPKATSLPSTETALVKRGRWGGPAFAWTR